MTTLVQKLESAAKKFNSIACFGMDPVPARLPPGITMENASTFYENIFAEMKTQNVWPGAVKPNEGFFSKHDRQLGHLTFFGSGELEKVLALAKRHDLVSIFDAKRGDIGPSSQNYADEAKDVWNADAITISPYMGTDSVEPFIRTGAAYVLCRTSNPGAKELQNLFTVTVEELLEHKTALLQNTSTTNQSYCDKLAELFTKPLYLRVAQKIIDWDAINPGNVGAVVGATNMNELKDIARYFVASGKQIPLLIPGVGKQGAKAADVVLALREVGYDLSIVRINNSSELNFAWEKEGKSDDYAGAAVRALKKMNDEIGYTHAD